MDACYITQQVVRGILPNSTQELCPMSDGGDGFAQTLNALLRTPGKEHKLTVQNAVNEPIEASWYEVSLDSMPLSAQSIFSLRSGAKIALIEMARASGLVSVSQSKRNPLYAHTRGTGQLILDAAQAKMDAILLGVGGSATNDLGLGALSVLGVTFKNHLGKVMEDLSPHQWPLVASIEHSGVVLPPLFIASDVNNPLLGPGGATAVYGPQKGLKEEDFHQLEKKVETMSYRLCETFKHPIEMVSIPGSGAAGGIVFGLSLISNAHVLSGFELYRRWVDLDSKLRDADLVITGEGRFDDTSLAGKGPGEMVKMATSMNKRVLVVAGSMDREIATLLTSRYENCFGFEIKPQGYAVAQAKVEGPRLLAQGVRHALGSFYY